MKYLFDLSTLPAPEPNPMVRKVGKLEGKRCKTCDHLLRVTYRNKVYYKCQQRGVTHGQGTDHRQKWQACQLYERKDD